MLEHKRWRTHPGKGVRDVEGPADVKRMHVRTQPLCQAGKLYVAVCCTLWPILHVSYTLCAILWSIQESKLGTMLPIRC